MHLFRTYYVSIINTLHIFISFNPLKNPEESIVLLSSFTLKQTGHGEGKGSGPPRTQLSRVSSD